MKELKFIHITKTAGTSIENSGFVYGKLWGRFHEEYGWWHKFLPLQSKELKQKYDWFAVVRNPYARIISEFYCKWNSTPKNTTDVRFFNDVIQKNILDRSPTGHHWSEQYKYIDADCKIHILKFENLNLEFNDLMKLYNLNVKLKFQNNISKKFFSQFDLTRKTINLINDIYSEDFRYFNYKKLTKLVYVI